MALTACMSFMSTAASTETVQVSPYEEEFILITDWGNSGSNPSEWYVPLANNGEQTIQSFLSNEGFRAGGAVADFDGDGDLDFVLGWTQRSDMSKANFFYYNNQGTGTFKREPIALNVPAGPRSDNGVNRMAVGDFDNDGDTDFIVSIYRSSAVYLFNNGLQQSGVVTFSHSTLPDAANDLATDTKAGDFDRDGDTDIFVSDLSGVWLYINDGQGKFKRNPEPVINGTYIISMTVGDFTSDGHLDVIVQNLDGNTLLHTGNGTSIFSSGIYVAPGYEVVDAYDVNHDGYLDLLVTDFFGSTLGSAVYWRAGTGQGAFGDLSLFIANGLNQSVFRPVAPVVVANSSASSASLPASSQDHCPIVDNPDQAATITALQEEVDVLKEEADVLNTQKAQLQSQVETLQAALDLANNTLDQTLSQIEKDFQTTFRDPDFSIPGGTRLERQNQLIDAVIHLNKGRKMGLYQNLEGKQ